MHFPDIRKLSGRLSTPPNVLRMYGPRRTVQDVLAGIPLEQVEEAAAPSRQVMHGAVGAAADTVLNLNEALVRIRVYEIVRQTGSHLGPAGPIDRGPILGTSSSLGERELMTTLGVGQILIRMRP